MLGLLVGAGWGLAVSWWLSPYASRHSRPRRSPADRPRSRAPWRPEPSRRWAVALTTGATLGLLLLHPVLSLLPGLVIFVWPRWQTIRQQRRHRAAVITQLPDVIDLLRLTVAAGLPVSGAVTAIGARPGGPVGAGLAAVSRQLATGASTATALPMLVASCGAPVRPLVDTLIDHDRYGTPLSPALDRVSIEARLQRRRHAEEAARKLPVKLLFPLVFTTLPACALLTVVPLLVASLSALQPAHP